MGCEGCIDNTLARKSSCLHVITKIKANLVCLSAVKSGCSTGAPAVKWTPCTRWRAQQTRVPCDARRSAALNLNQRASPSVRVSRQQSPWQSSYRHLNCKKTVKQAFDAESLQISPTRITVGRLFACRASNWQKMKEEQTSVPPGKKRCLGQDVGTREEMLDSPRILPRV